MTINTQFRQYFKKATWIVVVLTIAGAGISFFVSSTRAPVYDTSISFSINRTIRQNTSAYQYDGYYAIQASDLFSQTVMSWFMTPSVLLEIYHAANIDPQISSIEGFTSRFKTKQFSPQNIVVRFKERDHQTAATLSQAIIKIVQDKAVASNQSEEGQGLFNVVGSEPVIVQKSPMVWVTTLIGGVVGFLLSLAVLGIAYYLRGGPNREGV